MPGLHINRRRLAGVEAMAMQLADYGVPVRICDGMTARDVVAELGAHAPASRRAA